MIRFENYHKSRVVVGESFKNLIYYIPEEKRERLVIVTDTNVGRIYENQFPTAPVIKIGTGESNKTLETVYDIVSQLIELGADRHSFLVGIGGGVVCDITGYAASIYMRGISFGYVSTSLLSQIDASIGGKTGVNYKGYKNILGTFNQPEFVICDLEMLKTLPEDEIKNGITEAIKHAIIGFREYFNFIEDNAEKLITLDRPTIENFVARSIEIKTAVVERDEREKGERKKLNFGHTFGHAIESLSGIPHGHAVGIGMLKAAAVAANLGYCKSGLVDDIKDLLLKFDLPVETDLPDEALIEVMRKDKKTNKENIDFVFLREIGHVVIRSIPIQQLITQE